MHPSGLLIHGKGHWVLPLPCVSSPIFVINSPLYPRGYRVVSSSALDHKTAFTRLPLPLDESKGPPVAAGSCSLRVQLMVKRLWLISELNA